MSKRRITMLPFVAMYEPRIGVALLQGLQLAPQQPSVVLIAVRAF